ncbi:MAG: ribonuclease P protein component [Defluviitaleaceae bacterium]|nr:ribonuclease P protein component [Defluviitaleaceae bacterium]
MSCLPESIRKPETFKKVYSRGRYAADGVFVVYALANDLGTNRLGITVSKKVGNAVRRNLLRRLVKEMLRAKGGIRPFGYDVVVLARPPAGLLERSAAFAAVDKSLSVLFKRLGLSFGGSPVQ